MPLGSTIIIDQEHALDLVWLSKDDGRARVGGRTIPNDILQTSSLVKVAG